MGFVITGTASYVPEKTLTNFDLEKMVDTTDEWIRKRTGISERRISEPDIYASDLMVSATKKLLAETGGSMAEYDLIITAAPLREAKVPRTSDIFAQKMGAPSETLTIDVDAQCATFPWAVATACEMMTTNPNYQKTLIASADATSKSTDYTDRGSCILFGDAGAAQEITYSLAKKGIIGYKRYANREYIHCLNAPDGGKMHFGENGGTDLMKGIVQLTPKLLDNFLKDHNISFEQIDMVIPHQLNKRVTDHIKKYMRKNGLKSDDAFYDDNIARYGNCSATSGPLALDTCYREGRLKPGDLVLMILWGAGMTVGIVAFYWTLPHK